MAKTRISKARISLQARSLQARSLQARSLQARSLQALLVGLVALACLSFSTSQAGPIQWATVGDPGNAADTNGRGAVANSFQIMKYEFTNQQYADFLNAVAATDRYALYNTNMGSSARGGITRSGGSGSYSYTVKSNMEYMPVNFISWFHAARVANWLQNGATGSSSTETGAYTIITTGTAGQPVQATKAVPVNPGATYFIPTQDQWYKAAYYSPNYGTTGGPGYYAYGTQSDAAPTAVHATNAGDGSYGGVSPVTGNFANFNNAAAWNGEIGNVTTVGTNGDPSYYGAYDMSGNVTEWNDLNGAGAVNGLLDARGGSWSSTLVSRLSSSYSYQIAQTYDNDVTFGFRLARPIPVPEPSTWVMGLAGLACGAWQAARLRRRAG